MDHALRAITDDGAFRVITVRTTDLAQSALQRQQLEGQPARLLAELLTGAILVRETMAPTHRLQALFSSAERGLQLVADTHPDGGTRGLARGKPEAPVRVAGGTLQMMRTLFTGELHRGTVEVPKGGGLSQGLMAYMQSSEQVASMVAVACVLEDLQVRAAGGYIVQLLPEVGHGPLSVMAERLRDFEDIGPALLQTDAAPEPLLAELLYGMPYTTLETRPLSFKCRCNAVRVISSLATLGKQELSEMIDEGKVIDMSCDYCGQGYRISPNQLRGLLEQS